MAKPIFVFSHWNTMIQGLKASPQEFFSKIEERVRAKQLSQAKHSRVDWKEGGVLSAKREYLRIQRKEHAFDICGAPFGNGFFVSWWLGETPSGIWALLLRIPVVGAVIQKVGKPLTYYRIDTASMFQSLVHSAVTEVIDDMTKASGLRSLSEGERKPEMKSFFST